MSCFKKRSTEDVENEKISKNIENQIKEDRKKESNQIKLLLLGAQGSISVKRFAGRLNLNDYSADLRATFPVSLGHLHLRFWSQ